MALVTTTGPRTALHRSASSPDVLALPGAPGPAPIAAAGDKRGRVSSSSSQSAASHGRRTRERSENAGAALELPRFSGQSAGSSRLARVRQWFCGAGSADGDELDSQPLESLRRKLDAVQLELATARKDLESVTADRNRWQEGYRYQVELLQTELARSNVDVAALVAGVREELSFWHSTHPRGLSLTEVTQHNVVAHVDALRAGGRLSALFCLVDALVSSLAPPPRPSAPPGDAARAAAVFTASLVTGLLGYAGPMYQSPMYWQLALFIKTLTSSALALNALHHLLPGTPGDSTLAAFKARHVQQIADNGIELRGDTNRIFVFDGVGKRHLHSCRVSMVSSAGAAGSESVAVTSLMVVHLLDCPTLLQKLVGHSPALRPAVDTLSDDFLMLSNVPKDDAVLSHIDVLEAEQLYAKAAALYAVLSSSTRAPDGVWSCSFTPPAAAAEDADTDAPVAAGATAADVAAAAAAASLEKRCLACGVGHPRWTRGNCRGCGAPLPTMDAVRAADAAAAAETGAAAAAPHPAASRAPAAPLCRSSAAVVTGGSMQPVAAAIARVAAHVPDPATAVDVLPVLPYEPVGHYKIRKVYTRIGELAGLRGFVPDDKVRCEWTFVMSDQGAVDLTALLSDSKFRNLDHIPGPGHEEAIILRLAHHLLIEFGAGDLIRRIYSKGAQNYLIAATDVHQTRDWVLRVLYPALWRALARAYVLYSPGDKSMFGFDAWLATSRAADPRIAFTLNLLENLLAGLQLFHAGVRSNDATAYRTGRLAALPYLPMRAARNYFPLIANDVAAHLLSTPEVRKMRDMHISLLGQGIDYKLEEVNKDFQGATSGVTVRDWMFASAFRDANKECRLRFFDSIGMQDRYAEGSRYDLDVSAEVSAVEAILHASSALVPRAAGCPFVDLNGAPLLAEAAGMLAAGKAVVAAAAVRFKAGEKLVVGAAMALSAAEAKKGVEDADKYHTQAALARAAIKTLSEQVEAHEAAMAAEPQAAPA